MKKEKIVFTKIGTGCSFPKCEKVSGYKVKFKSEILYLCEQHKNYFRKKLNIDLIEVDSRTFNQIPPKFKKYLAEEEGISNIKSRSIVNPITSTKTWNKLTKKEKEFVHRNRVIREMQKKQKELKYKTTFKLIGVREQKTITGIFLGENIKDIYNFSKEKQIKIEAVNNIKFNKFMKTKNKINK